MMLSRWGLPTLFLMMLTPTWIGLNTMVLFGRVEVVSDEKILDGTFGNGLGEVSALPMELGIGGTWEGSETSWNRWIDEKLAL